jgi:hypothetical protein
VLPPAGRCTIAASLGVCSCCMFCLHNMPGCRPLSLHCYLQPQHPRKARQEACGGNPDVGASGISPLGQTCLVGGSQHTLASTCPRRQRSDPSSSSWCPGAPSCPPSPPPREGAWPKLSMQVLTERWGVLVTVGLPHKVAQAAHSTGAPGRQQQPYHCVTMTPQASPCPCLELSLQTKPGF